MFYIYRLIVSLQTLSRFFSFSNNIVSARQIVFFLITVNWPYMPTYTYTHTYTHRTPFITDNKFADLARLCDSFFANKIKDFRERETQQNLVHSYTNLVTLICRRYL